MKKNRDLILLIIILIINLFNIKIKIYSQISGFISEAKNSIDEADQSIIISNIYPTPVSNGGIASPYLQEETTDKNIKECTPKFIFTMEKTIEGLKSFYKYLPNNMIQKIKDYIILNKQIQDIIFQIRNYDFFGLNNPNFTKEYNPQVSGTQYDTRDIIAQCKTPTDIFRQCAYENDIMIPISQFELSSSAKDFHKEVEEKFANAEKYKLCSKNYVHRMKEVLNYIVKFSPPAPPEVIKNAQKYMSLAKHRLDLETKVRYYEEFITNNIINGYQILSKVNIPIVSYTECIDKVTNRKA